MKKVVLDTNFLIAKFQFKIDILNEIREILGNAEFVVMEQCYNELKKLSEKDIYAKMALGIAKGKDIKIIKGEKGNADNAIISWAAKNNAYVATQDSELRKRLKKRNIPIILIRQRKKVVVSQ